MKCPDIAAHRLAGQHIAFDRFEKPGDVVACLTAMQAQDYHAALWAVGLRMESAAVGQIEKALEEKAFVRTWPLRGTLHFAASKDVRWMLALLRARVITGNARRYRELELDEAAFTRSKKLFVKALQGGNRLTREAMYTLLEKACISPAGQRGIHILQRLALEGILCHGARMGRQETFVILDEWLPPSKELSRDEALAELAGRYFKSHGPATLKDFTWWAGLAAADARSGLEMALNDLDAQDIGGETYWLSRNAQSTLPTLPTRSTRTKAPSAHFLPAFDEYLVAYKDRSAAIEGMHADRLAGLLSPTIILDGRVVGTWTRALKRDAVVVSASLFARHGKDDLRALDDAVLRYGDFLGIKAELRLTFPSRASAPQEA